MSESNISPQKDQPYRFSADLEKMDGDSFVIIKLGFSFHSLQGLWEFINYFLLIKKSAQNAQAMGLYKTEYFLYSPFEAGMIQYWRSFDNLEKWACKSPEHVSWWKKYRTEKQWKHLSVYHESFTIDKYQVQTIYDWSPQVRKESFPGLAGFLPHISPAKYRAKERFLQSPNKVQ